MKLSVVVPAYKEGKHIYRNLCLLKKSLDEVKEEYEIVVVSDGNTDNTYEEAKKLESKIIKVWHYEPNMGKGYALKYGVDRAQGELVTFIDADMGIHPKEIQIFIKLMDAYNADIIIGSKRHPQSKVNYPLFRRFQSFCYQTLIALLFQLNIKDTQTGLKLFRKEVLEAILPRAVVKRYAFDLELMVIAHHLGYKKILEAPVEIKYPFPSTVKLESAWNVLWETLAIFYRLHFLKYYEKPHFRTPAETEIPETYAQEDKGVRESSEDLNLQLERHEEPDVGRSRNIHP